MRRSALEVLACPNCLNRLSASEGDAILEEGEVRCETEGLVFPIRGGVPYLVRSNRTEEVEAFAKSYSAAWQKEGWGAPDEAYLLGLPYVDRTGRQTQKWRVKARSMEALLSALELKNRDPVVDLGGGVGWLSHQLATKGYEVYEIDALRDNVLGLGAARTFVEHGPHFERVWGELERPPFRGESVAAVFYNASLHYARDLVGAVSEAGRILRPGGLLAVFNSPMHQDASSASRAQVDFQNRLRRLGGSEDVASRYHHLLREIVEEALANQIGPVREVAFEPGIWFRLFRQMKGLLLRMELASFPILISRKASTHLDPPPDHDSHRSEASRVGEGGFNRAP